METRKISVVNMNNNEDAEKIKGVLRDVWGIRHFDVNLVEKEAIFSYDEKAASYIDFEQAIADCGYIIAQPEGNIKHGE